jgi:phytanoyl-CoA dioxygenase PhyH
MELGRDGARQVPALFSRNEIEDFARALDSFPPGRPGARLAPIPGMAAQLRLATEIAQAVLGAAARPVRATLFDKSTRCNWALGWHQDRTIAVRERRETAGFADWTVKQGIVHVVPPFALIERMLTLRIHLDPAGAGNAPLLVAPGSHRLGRIAEAETASIVSRLGAAVCTAERGDVWLYATPILHASARAAVPRRRRVLQLLYSADALPGGLEWGGRVGRPSTAPARS